VLLAPDRQLAVYFHLAVQNAVDPFVERFLRVRPVFFRDECVIGLVRVHVAQQLHRAEHRVVVEGDVTAVVVLQRIPLRPAAVGVLHLE